MSGSTLVSLLCSETIWTGSTLRNNELVSGVQGEADQYVREGLGGILGEHRDHDLGDDVQLRLVKSRNLDQDILGI